ncbi:hypothetical protein AB0F49_17465 [Micromonospora ureilytica]|uniref:hypothetical protein n=1 Tax=Micromonospora ureilytica TaxID=709868 RepID=UPI00340F1733
MARAPTRSSSAEIHRASNHLWLNSPFLLPDFGKLKFTLLVAALIYSSAFVVSATLGFGQIYLASPAFALGAAGAGWVGGSIRASAKTADQLYDDLASAFGIPRIVYVRLLNRHFERICDWRGHALSAAVFLSLIAIAAYISFFVFPLRVWGESQRSLRPWVFSPKWYAGEHVNVKFAIVVYFGIWISVALGVTVWLFMQDLRLLQDLSALPVLPVPESLRAQLRLVADWHVSVAIDWALGAILFVVMFSKTPDYLSILVIVMLIAAGSAVLVYPQLLFARIVRNAHDRSCRIAIAVYARSKRSMHRITDEQRVEMLTGLAEISTRPRFWVYSADEMMRWSLAQAVAFAALVAQIYSNRKG